MKVAFKKEDQHLLRLSEESFLKNPYEDDKSAELLYEHLLNDKTVAANDVYWTDTADVGIGSGEAQLFSNIPKIGGEVCEPVVSNLQEGARSTTKCIPDQALDNSQEDAQAGVEDQLSSLSVDDKTAEFVCKSGADQEYPEVVPEHKFSDMHELSREIIDEKGEEVVELSSCSAVWTFTARQARLDWTTVMLDLRSSQPEIVASAAQPGQRSSSVPRVLEVRDDVEILQKCDKGGNVVLT